MAVVNERQSKGRLFAKLAGALILLSPLLAESIQPPLGVGAGFTDSRVQMRSFNSQIPNVEILGSGELVDLMPGTYSPIVRQNHLIPRVFRADVSANDRILAADAYLMRFERSLASPNEAVDEIPATYGIDSAYPIDLPNGPRSSISEIVAGYLKDKESGQLDVAFDPNLSFNTSNQHSDLELKDHLWVSKKSHIVIGGWLTDNFYNPVERDSFFSGVTDLEVAAIIMHEYSHGLQLRARLKLVNDRNEILKIDETSEKGVKEDLSYMEKELNQDATRQIGLEAGKTLQLQEAQANGMAYLFLYALNELNGSDHIVGSEYQDPTREYVRAVRSASPSYQNLYRIFKGTVLRNANGSDPTWLKASQISE